MAWLNISKLGNALQDVLMCEEIIPGAPPSYQTCKTIYAYHPLGAKIAESPIKMAQSQARQISIPKGPEERVRDQFLKEWEGIGADKHIFQTKILSRVYGIASCALVSEGTPPDRPIDYKALSKAKIGFNVLDPLNTAGSLVLNQDPNSIDFQKTHSIAVGGKRYHSSRTCITLNEAPLYIEYTNSAFGYVGRSAYQRALFPLKSFIQSMVTDDMVTKKAGVLVEKIKAQGSIIDAVMATMTGLKRMVLKQAEVGNVISIGIDEFIESVDLKNLDGPYTSARRNVLENIATSVPMPAKLLLQESFAEGFGEGTEDAKYIADFIEGIRTEMNPLYAFFDKIVQYRAWNQDFYAIIQDEFPEYRKIAYNQAFYDWTNSFQATWPSLITEPPSEKILVDDVKLKATIALVEVLLPALDPVNKVAVISWAADNFNELKLLFTTPLVIDMDELENYKPEANIPGLKEGGLEEPKPPKPFRSDSYDDAINKLKTMVAAKQSSKRERQRKRKDHQDA